MTEGHPMSDAERAKREDRAEAGEERAEGYEDRAEASEDRAEAREERAVAKEKRTIAAGVAHDIRVRDWTRVAVWVFAVLCVLLAGLAWQIEARSKAITALLDASERVEVVATNTEEILVGLLDERSTPEGQAQAARVAEALNEIAEIKLTLCVLLEQQDEAFGLDTVAATPMCPIR